MENIVERFESAFSTLQNVIADIAESPFKAWVYIRRWDPEKGLVVKKDTVAIKAREKGTGRKCILFVLRESLDIGDVVEWEANQERKPAEMWQVEWIEYLGDVTKCLVQPFSPKKNDTVLLLMEAGFAETAEYLKAARSRLQGGEPTDWADCKTNCRNALTSLFNQMTGTEDTRAACKTLTGQGLIGEREKDVMQAFENFLASLVSLLSKKGPHPPTPSREDAQFAFSITEAAVRFLVHKMKKAS